MVMWYKKCIWSLSMAFDRACKALRISWVMGFVIPKEFLWSTPQFIISDLGQGHWGHLKDEVTKGWNFQLHPQPSGKGLWCERSLQFKFYKALNKI